MAARDINELFQWLRPPINWDPVPDWVLDRIDERIRIRLFLGDVEFQRNVMQLQLDALNAKAEILQKELGG
jgi:hypothetical protein